MLAGFTITELNNSQRKISCNATLYITGIQGTPENRFSACKHVCCDGITSTGAKFSEFLTFNVVQVLFLAQVLEHLVWSNTSGFQSLGSLARTNFYCRHFAAFP